MKQFALLVVLLVSAVAAPVLLAEDPATEGDIVEWRVLCPREKVAPMRQAAARLGVTLLPPDEATTTTEPRGRPSCVPTAAWDLLMEKLCDVHPLVVQVTGVRVYQSVVVLGLRSREREFLRATSEVIQMRMAKADLLSVSPTYRLEGNITECRLGYETSLVLVFRSAVIADTTGDEPPADEEISTLVADAALASGGLRWTTEEQEVEALQPRRVTWQSRTSMSDLRSALLFFRNVAAKGAMRSVVLLTAEWEAEDLSPLPEGSPRGATWLRLGAVPW